MQLRIARAPLFVASSLVAIAAAVAQIPPDNPPASGTASPIEHLVVIFQENVSFDHYFATYPNALNTAGEPVFVPHAAAGRTPGVNGLTGPLLTHNPNS